MAQPPASPGRIARNRGATRSGRVVRTATTLAALALSAVGSPAMAIEKPGYRVVQQLEEIEVREYASYLVAETDVVGDRAEAGNEGFRRLAAYIFGKNRGERKIAMTAPVTQEQGKGVPASGPETPEEGRRAAAASASAPEEGKRISMTAPVTQQEAGRGAAAAAVLDGGAATGGPPTWVIQFMMPSELALETLPEPLDPSVRLRAVPARRFAVLRYSGTWSESRYEENLALLRAAMEKAGLHPAGEPVWARYDPPFMPWFLRTNEIWIELER